MPETIKAWHFVADTLRDGRPVPKDGVWLRHEGRIKICASGLHASLRPWDALKHTPGATLCYVECRGDVQQQSDKLACRERRIIMRADVTETLRYFARMQALSAINLWPSAPPDVVLDYLMTGDESLRRASLDASRAATNAAANAASRVASRAAARAAAWDAAWDAAWAAARAAASAASRAAARGAANTAASVAAITSLVASAADFDALIREQFGVAT